MRNDSLIEQIKDRIDIVELIGSYLKLEKTGANYRALCPFHSEKKPSFFVSPSRQIFKCFGCGEGGSIFDFVMKIEGVEFGDALRILAQKAGIELKPFKKELQTERTRLYEICELACRFFETQLEKSTAGKKAKEYLLKRGLTEESVKKWRIGYAPNLWRALSDFLVGRGYKREEVVKAGLAVESEKSQTPYDRFRGRIIFPVFDLHSQVVGFGGRVFEGEEEGAKYINTPNTLIYDKSRILYGLNFAKVAVREKDFCILTEGYMDVILSHQAGVENAVASSGTALTPLHLKILKRYTSKIFTAFDMDTAGNLATQRGIDLAHQQDFQVKVIEMPKDKDPADVIYENPQKWEEAIEKAKDIMEFYFTTSLSKFDKETPEGKRGIAETLLPKIKQIPNKIVQFHWIQKLSRVLGVAEEAIVEELKKLKEETSGILADSQEESDSLKEKPLERNREALLEERILALLLKEPSLFQLLENDLSLFSENIKHILETLKERKFEELKEKEDSLEKLFENLAKDNKEISDILNTALLRAEVEEEENLQEEFSFCLDRLRELKTRSLLQELSEKIKLAQEKGDKKELESLIQQFNQTAKHLQSIKK